MYSGIFTADGNNARPTFAYLRGKRRLLCMKTRPDIMSFPLDSIMEAYLGMNDISIPERRKQFEFTTVSCMCRLTILMDGFKNCLFLCYYCNFLMAWSQLSVRARVRVCL